MQQLGLFQEGDSFKMALASKKRGKPIIHLVRLAHRMGELDDVKPLYMLQKTLAENQYRLISGLPSSSIFIRTWEAKLPKLLFSKALCSILRFQIEKIVPFTPEQTIASLKLDHKDNKHMLAITTKEFLKTHLEEAKIYGIDPEIVGAPESALQRWSEWLHPELSAYLMVYLSDHQITLLLVQNKMVRLSQTIPYGVSSLLSALKKDKPDLSLIESQEFAKKIDLLRMNKNTFSNLFASLIELRQQLNRSLSFIKTTLPEAQFTELLLAGEVETTFKIAKFLKEIVEKTPVDPPPVKGLSQTDLFRFAVPIGLALDGFTDNPTNFRMGEFIQEKLTKKRLLKSSLFLAASLFLFIFLSGYSLLLMEKEIELGAKKFAHYAEKLGGYKIKNNGDLSREINRVTLFLKENPVQPLNRKLPTKVSTLLRLLAEKFPREEDSNIEITHLNYTLKSYPTIEKRGEPFSTLIELEFKAENSKSARKFYADLEGISELVDARKEKLFEIKKGYYKISFHLN